jgi:hypothetical protein
MATVIKDFKVKNGLVVEGSTATVNNFDVLTKKEADQTYIIGLIGGTATDAATANTVVKRNGNASFSANVITADLVGDVTGQVSDISNFDTNDLDEGTTNLYFSNARAQAAVAGDITSAINGLDTDDIEEGTSNLYFSNARALAATASAYDAAGTGAAAANVVAGNLSTHESDTSAHGVTGNVVGTSDTQTLSNKTFSDTLNFTGAGAMTISSDSHIVLTPAANSSVKWGADILATQDYAEGYTDNAISALVDSAPELLNTLNELAAAIGDDANFATTLANSVATKQDILVEGSNIDITGNTISVTGLDTDDVSEGTNLYFTNARAQGAFSAGAGILAIANGVIELNLSTGLEFRDGSSGGVRIDRDQTDTWYDALGTAANALSNAQSYTDNAISVLDTDDIEEGTSNLYFSNARSKSAAADLLTGATLSNITITGTGSGLTITAENGVGDSDTDDLVEGTSNLYFSNARAVSALEAVVPKFTAVELNTVAKQIAATLSAPTAGIQVAHSFAKATYRSAEYLVKVAYGSHTEISKVLLTLDTADNIAITEYAIVGTNGSASTISAAINGSNVELRVTTANNTSTVTVVGTLVA